MHSGSRHAARVHVERYRPRTRHNTRTAGEANYALGAQVVIAHSTSEMLVAKPLDSDQAGACFACSVISGADLTRNPKYNKGLAFTEGERDRLYLRGLLPPAILSQDVQVPTQNAPHTALSRSHLKMTHICMHAVRMARSRYRGLRMHKHMFCRSTEH